jgi:ATP-binding cassette, subfamily B, multidrug efflux pump
MSQPAPSSSQKSTHSPPQNSPKPTKEPTKSKELRVLGSYLRNHSRQYWIGTLVVVVSNVAVLLPPYFIGRTIDAITTGKIHAEDLGLFGWAAQPALSNTVLLELGIMIVLSGLLAGVLTLTMRRQLVVASRQIDYEIRRDIFSRLTHLDKDFYDGARTGDLMNRLTGDLMSVREMLGFGFWQVFNVIAVFGASFVVMFSLSSTLAWLVMAMMPIMVGFLVLVMRVIAKRYVAVQEQNSTISAKAQENFSGVRVVKGYAVEDIEIKEYRALNDDLIEKNMALTRVEGPIWSFMTLLMGIAYVLVLLVGGRMILGLGGGSLTLGQFTQFVLTLERLSWPMLSVGIIVNLTQRGFSSWTRLYELLEAKAKINDQAAGNQVETSFSPVSHAAQLEFKNVSLTLGSSKILKNINLSIPAGQTIGITGPTGSGKTMLAQLITRFSDPTEGSILLSGQDIRTMPLKTLRDHIGMVPQEPFLFSETIAENIAFGMQGGDQLEVETGKSVLKTKAPPRLEKALEGGSNSTEDQTTTRAKVKEAARLAGLSGDIEGFVEGYDTMLGERGVTLSGGQRQRTALARAIARDPQILILDDSMSAVDTETEARILNGLRELSSQNLGQNKNQTPRTVILIGHRVSTLRQADHIIVLKEGQILERGTHQELIDLNGHYADLERKQSLAASLEEDPALVETPIETGAKL